MKRSNVLSLTLQLVFTGRTYDMFSVANKALVQSNHFKKNSVVLFNVRFYNIWLVVSEKKSEALEAWASY